MTLNELMPRLARHNIDLWLEGDRLRYRAPDGALTADLRNSIVAHRPEIIASLRAPWCQPKQQRCAVCSPKNWMDAPPKEGRIRTTCADCGRFIGYRPIGP